MPDQTSTQIILRALPSVDALLRTDAAQALRARTGAQRLTVLARAVTDELRAELQAGAELQARAGNSGGGDGATSNDDSRGGGSSDDDSRGADFSRASLLSEASRRLALAVERDDAGALRRVVNATGVILHTNLGRAPLSDAARRAVADEAARYCTLEYDTETGARGRRGGRVEALLAELTGAEAAIVVNNCAAAALLVLTALARDGETIVSRGELVEIGGDFRVPDVMAQSGTRMVEVGTTNRTRVRDYERAITPQTRLILRVHPSNYRLVGFTAAPALAELAALAREANLPLFEDAGSGALLDLSAAGLSGEPVIGDSIRDGACLVAFSGDKLLGASQAGLIVGRRALVETLRRHPLYRALRADKLALAALEATLDAHRRGASLAEVPSLRMLATPRAEIERRARALVRRLRARLSPDVLRCEIIDGESAVGGGSAPTTHPPTALIALAHAKLSATTLEERLRRSSPPIIARILDERVVLDLRTVAADEETELLDALVSLGN